VNVVYPPTIDFDFMRQRPQQLMTQFARHGHLVFFCNKTQHPGREPERVEKNLWIVHDHDSFVKNQARKVKPTLVWCSWAKLHNTLSLYRPSMVVYDCLDDFPVWRPYEEAMLKRATAVVATARTLKERLERLHPRVALVPNGCEYELFNRKPPGPPPADLPAGPRRAGFVGALGSWFDADLVRETARRLRRWQFVLVGPPFGTREVSGPNIFSLGMKPYSEIPSYIHNFDVALIPFLDDQITRATNPIKMWEYLATGVPVVSTPIPEVLPFSELVRIGEGPEFARQIERVRDDGHLRRKRKQLAKANSWRARYEAIARFIPELAPRV